MNKWIKGAAVAVTALTMAATAQAAEWSFYGNARIGTFYTDTDDGAGNSADDYNQYLHGNSRIGAKIKVSDELKARFEYGASKGNANIRQLWGEWNFGAGKLLVGQTYTPIYMGYSNQAFDEDLGLEGYGTVSASRKPMLQLTFGGFKIAAVNPSTDDLGSGMDIETSYPKLEASYELSMDNLSFEINGGYSAYEIGSQYDIDAYVFGAGGEVKFGGGYIAASVFFGQNLGTYGFKISPDADPEISGGEVLDNDNFGYNLIVGYKLNDMFALEAGYGYIEAELDNAVNEDDAACYYLQAKITLAPGVYVIPEIGKIDEGDDMSGAEEGDTTYFGAKWQINF